MTRITFDDPRLPPKFWDRVVPEPNSGCWIWLSEAYVEYGQFRLSPTRSIAAHRLILLIEGRILDGKVVDHRCETKCCVNPDHLDVVTRGENTRRFYRRYLHWTVLNKLGLWNHAHASLPSESLTKRLNPRSRRIHL